MIQQSAPLIGFLLAIGVLPVITPSFWKRHAHVVIAGFAFFALYVTATTVPESWSKLTHELWNYIAFIILIRTLYIVSTGMTVFLHILPTPLNLTLYLGAGVAMASLLGTTGTAMLLIMPLIRLLEHRSYKTHTLVFFIFLVANCGGCLTPLGDPPLFMGFLQGVPFFWPLQHLWPMFLCVNSLLLLLHFAIDTYYYRSEHIPVVATTKHYVFRGKRHVGILAAVLAVVFIMGCRNDMWLSGNLMLLLLSRISQGRRHINFEPVHEVAQIFLVLFIALIPMTEMLTGLHWTPSPFRYFWLAGLFSAFLDNAPTYLVFFKMAGCKVMRCEETIILQAISVGSIFMGALTYIGNAPNLMVKAVAEKHGARMPSFIGYMGWSFLILLPIFIFLSVVFFL